MTDDLLTRPITCFQNAQTAVDSRERANLAEAECGLSVVFKAGSHRSATFIPPALGAEVASAPKRSQPASGERLNYQVVSASQSLLD